MTLCAATSVNVAATIRALQHSLDQVEFGECLLFADACPPELDPRIRMVEVQQFTSGADYSNFMLTRLAEFIRTDHCLVAQWDGFDIDAARCDPNFLAVDYDGAPWPQFHDGHDVGNGGFSLRSRKLLEACRDPSFRVSHPEDIAICRINREMLEREHGIRFADRETANRFSAERSVPGHATFGFHGIFNMIRLLGPDRFWEVYRSLDHKGTAFVDYLPLMRGLGGGAQPLRRRLRLSMDYLAALAKG